jgi:uncharacterized protein (DUF1330 family)
VAPAFIIATVRITDPDRFAAYAKATTGLREAFGGETLVRGPVTEVLEGEGVLGDRMVVLRFPNADAARAYIGSQAYQAVKHLRRDAAEVVMRLVEP